MNKTALKYVSELSKHCPTILEQSCVEKSWWTGSDLLLSGVQNQQNLKPDELYPVPYPVLREVNHKIRLKKQYKRHGKNGIINYLKPFIQVDKFANVQVFIMNNIP